MLAPTHLVIGFTVGDLLAGQIRRELQDHRLARKVLIITTFFSIVPDVDILWMIIRNGISVFGDAIGMHHFYPTHIPAFYLGVAAIFTALTSRISPSYRWLILAALIGAISHFVLDSFLIGWGVMWLYPFSRKLIGWNIVTWRYQAEWGDHWLAHYLVSPFALIEYGLIVVGLVWAKLRSESEQHPDGKIN